MNVLGGVERGALVAELVVGLGLVHVVGAARVGVVVDRDEQVGGEGGGPAHALGEVGAQRAVGGGEVVPILIARQEHLGAAGGQQVAQLERHRQVDLGLAQAAHAERAAEEPAVPRIERDAPSHEDGGIEGRETVGQPVVAGTGTSGPGRNA